MTFKRAMFAAGAVAVAYLVFVLASGLGFNPTGESWDFSVPGQFGDSFGPLNTFMAALAAVGALGAYFAQREELADAKISASTDRKLASKRDFESTFFNLISLFRDTTNDIEVPDQYNQKPVRGRDAIKRIIEEKIGGTQGNDEADSENYNYVYLKNRDDLAHYFRTIYHIVKFIDDSDVEDKRLYARLLRASLSNSEALLIALNCSFGEGRTKFRELIEKYALLHNLSEDDAQCWRLIDKFSEGAFGDRPEMIARLKQAREERQASD
jgi:hypothetical protein